MFTPRANLPRAGPGPGRRSARNPARYPGTTVGTRPTKSSTCLAAAGHAPTPRVREGPPGRAGQVTRSEFTGALVGEAGRRGDAEAPISTPPGGARRGYTPPRASANPGREDVNVRAAPPLLRPPPPVRTRARRTRSRTHGPRATAPLRARDVRGTLGHARAHTSGSPPARAHASGGICVLARGIARGVNARGKCSRGRARGGIRVVDRGPRTRARARV